MDLQRLSRSLLVVAVVVLAACANGAEPAAEQSPTAVATAPAATGGAGKSRATPADSPADEASADQTLVVDVRDGQVQGGALAIEAAVGETVTFRVRSDVADVVHVHGFDHHFAVVPGEETVVEFTAEFAGQFEVELEEAGLRIVELEIR